jgi:fructosamine-3-kinase
MYQQLLLHVAALLGAEFKEMRPLQGGDINDVYLLKTNKGSFVVKINSSSRFPEMFSREAEGLELLRNTKTFRLPKVIMVEQLDDMAALVLEFIPQAVASTAIWEKFGQQLAQLHQHSQEYFGLESDNYIGALAQDNQPSSSWPAFYITQRLYPQIELALAQNRMDKPTGKAFHKLFAVLPELLPEEKPALIHGDLWNGNYLIDDADNIVLIDPAVSYANREMDLAMTDLFGGFPPRFYEAYQDAFPTPKGLEERIKIYQLYYLLVHLNLFGSSYLSAIQRIISKYL